MFGIDVAEERECAFEKGRLSVVESPESLPKLPRVYALGQSWRKGSRMFVLLSMLDFDPLSVQTSLISLPGEPMKVSVASPATDMKEFLGKWKAYEIKVCDLEYLRKLSPFVSLAYKNSRLHLTPVIFETPK